jgi:hypothetical protein
MSLKGRIADLCFETVLDQIGRTCPVVMRGEKVKSAVRHAAVQRRVFRGWLTLVATPEKAGWFSAREGQRMFAGRYATKTPFLQ